MEKCRFSKLLCGSIVVIALFIVQKFAGTVGGAVADLFSYQRFDFHNLYARVSIHHIIQMFIALIIIAILKKLLKVDFGFKLGDSKEGAKYLRVFITAFTIYTLICYTLMYIYNQLPTYNFPLNISNIIGTLGFQLFLSGTSEEILYRALPITVLFYVFGKSINIKWSVTLETIIAAFLFSIAHIKWSVLPFTMEVNNSQLCYAFVLGTIQGVAYQKSHSIIYPMLMHSFSNVLMVGMGYLFAIL